MKIIPLFIVGFLFLSAIIFSPIIVNYQHEDAKINTIKENTTEEITLPTLKPARAKIPYSEQEQTAINEIEKAVFNYINKERTLHGLTSLIDDEALTDIARKHSEDMCTYDYVSHINSQGKSPTDRADEAGYSSLKNYKGINYYGIGENLCAMPLGNVTGYGYLDKYATNKIAFSMVTALMNSEKHRENILDEEYTHIGNAVAYGYNFYYLTQNFW